MAKRVSWKKGMRLTEELLRASDSCHYEWLTSTMALASAGRFGLFSQLRQFEVSLNFTNGIVDVEALNCLALTKGGHLIDIHYDTRYSNTFETRVQIPDNRDNKEFILLVNAIQGKWAETNDGYESPEYDFSLIAENTPIPDNSMPIARIVNEYGWRMDDIDFVPPCLYITSHQKYIDLAKRFEEVLIAIDTRVRNLLQSNGRDAIRIFWPIVQQQMITINKEYDLMTPMTLMSNVQKCISAFTCACELDDYLELEEAEKFVNYIYTPYNYKDAFIRIKEGLELCFSINEKVGKFNGETREPSTIEAPTISDSQLFNKCTENKVIIQIKNNVSGATVYYTIDGSEPTQASRSGQVIKIDCGFNNSNRKEPDKVIVVKVKAILNGVSSNTNIYEIILQKDIKNWKGYKI